MSDEDSWGELRSGAMPDESIQMMDDRYDGLTPGEPARIAERILAEPATGREGARGDGWDIARDTVSLKDGETRGPSTRGLRPGYGDAAAREGYDARTGQ